jgi:hypothetical protein
MYMSTLFSIMEHGAVPDGHTINTTAIQSAIDAAHAAGGGRVLVPAGVFLTGSVFLKSRVVLDLSAGATLLGSPNLEDYTFVSWGHHQDRTPWHLINAQGQDNIAIIGYGEIRGNGPAFWKPGRPHEFAFWEEAGEGKRPSPMVEISDCRDVRIENVTIGDAAGWTLHLHDTDRAVITGVRIDSDLFGPNSDGIDLTGARDITISNCIIKAGDDAIALKTTIDSRSCEYVTVTNCVLETNCCAIRIGHESAQDFRHCTFSNCVVKRSSRIIDMVNKLGCTMEHISFSNISGTTNCGWPVNRAIQIQVTPIEGHYERNLFPAHPRYGKTTIPSAPGIVRHISFSDMDILTDGRILIGGQPDTTIHDLRFRNIALRYPMIDNPNPLAEEGNHSFFPGQVLRSMRTAEAAFVAQNVSDLNVDGFRVEWPQGPVPKNWRLLDSDHRFLNAEWYQNRDAAIRSREREPAFGVFWAKDVKGGTVTLMNSSGSQKEIETVSLEDCELTIRNPS